jgi:adenylate kinase family enzyme
MFLLVTGASGAGKSTVQRLIADELKPSMECAELHDVVEVPLTPTTAWRQRATEAVVRHALELQAQGRDLLLAGDPGRGG